jgi:hypothetical protein
MVILLSFNPSKPTPPPPPFFHFLSEYTKYTHELQCWKSRVVLSTFVDNAGNECPNNTESIHVKYRPCHAASYKGPHITDN